MTHRSHGQHSLLVSNRCRFANHYSPDPFLRRSFPSLRLKRRSRQTTDPANASPDKMVAVGIIGASGLVGQYLAEGFIANGSYQVSLLTRKGGNSSALAPLAAKGVEADFDDEASLVTALKGLEIAVSAVGTPGLAAQASVIKAAKLAGVRRYVPSEFGIDTRRPGIREYFPLLGYKFATQEALEASGLEYTYVINGMFLETIFTPAFFFDVANNKVTIKGKPDVPFVVTSLKDIGRWTAAALLDPASKNATIYLKGEELTMNQAVATIEKATGKKLEVTYKTAAELDADIAAHPDPFSSFSDLLVKAIADGWGGFPGKWAGQDTPVRTLAAWATTTTWQWNA